MRKESVDQTLMFPSLIFHFGDDRLKCLAGFSCHSAELRLCVSLFDPAVCVN